MSVPLLSAADRHLARRFTGGLTPALAAEVRRAGGGRAWFVDQLRPGRVADSAGKQVDGWFPSLRRTPEQIFDREQADVEGSWEVMYDLSRWTVARRIQSRRQVLESMVDFWSNLLHVPLMDDEAAYYRVSYDRTIRRYALSSFEALLRHTVVHPAMGLSLDNAVSTKDDPNENLGREVLELHTVGVEAGYTEAEVKASARMLTGYRVDVWWPRFRSFYDPRVHDTRPVSVLGFRHANADSDGRAATAAYLTHLAHHPATARRLAHRLCTRFVSDDPSPAIVAAVARAYRRHGTAIRPTLLALVGHPHFAASRGAKIRTPTEDYVATMRALRIRMAAPRSEESFANAMYWQYAELGNAPYEWPTPDGYPEQGAVWTSTGRVLQSLDTHLTLAGGWWPTRNARFRKPVDWLPRLPATLGDVVDHVARELLGQPASADVRRAVATIVGLPPTRRVTRDDLWDWRIVTMLATLLDSPTHLHR